MLRVLLIEDEPLLIETLPAVLKDKYSELQVQGMTSIPQALAKLKEKEFDVILLDIAMPPTEDMDPDSIEYGRLTGIEVARRIKEVKPGMPIVALTVVSDPSYQGRMRAVGIEFVINKPVDVDAIAQVLLRYS